MEISSGPILLLNVESKIDYKKVRMALVEKYSDILNVADIQKILAIGRRQAYELVNSGQFRVVRIGKTIRVHRDAFFEWLRG